MAEQQTAAAAAAPAEASTDELKRLIDQTAGEMGPLIEKETDETKKLVDAFVNTLWQGKVVKGDVVKRISQAIAWLDKRLSDQVNAIIHHPEFRALEGAWRGLKYLVDRKPPGQHLQVRVMNISKKELGAVLDKFSAEGGQTGWTQSPVFRQIFRDRFDTPGANPFGCIIGDYQFDKSAPDIKLLERMSQVCGAAHAPFISAAAPGLVGVKNWREMPDIAELDARMATPDYAAWNSLRQSEDSRYLSLTLPRFLARMPYGAGKNEVDGFAFEEDLRPVPGAEWSANETKHDNYIWSNAAYAMAANIAQTFHETCFCTAIRGVEAGGKVEGLPIDTFPTDDGGMDMKCPTEIAISQSKEAELGNLGFMPLSHWQNTDFAAFVGAQTVQKPQQYDNPRATENAELSARLPYVFMVSRFSQYLKKMLYEWVGTNRPREQLEAELNDWIKLYATAASSAEDEKRRKPLEDAQIKVEEVEGKPGYFHATAYLKPHIQLEGVNVDLGVVSKLPGGGG
jgi:type VI secretion system protein ImpC